MKLASFSIYELKLAYLFGDRNEMPMLLNDYLLFDSGRSALYFLLNNLTSDHNKYDVFVNAYTTDVVHTTIRSLGFNLIPYDINPHTFEAEVDISALSPKTIFIQTGLFGFKSFNYDLYKSVKSAGGIFIEDCCNSFKTQIDEKEAGTIGDASIYSFRVGKALSSGGGALRVINTEFQERLKSSYESLQEITTQASRLIRFRISLDYLAFEPFVLKNISRPLRKLQKAMPILNSLVKGGVVDTESEVDPSKIHKMGYFQLKLAQNRLARFNEEFRIKREVSAALSELLKKYPVHIYANDSVNRQGWNCLFYPLLLEQGDPDEFVEHMRISGFDATRFHYEAAGKSFPDLEREKYPGTFTLIDKLVVIPNTTRMRGKEQALVGAVEKYFRSYS